MTKTEKEKALAILNKGNTAWMSNCSAWTGVCYVKCKDGSIIQVDRYDHSDKVPNASDIEAIYLPIGGKLVTTDGCKANCIKAKTFDEAENIWSKIKATKEEKAEVAKTAAAKRTQIKKTSMPRLSVKNLVGKWILDFYEYNCRGIFTLTITQIADKTAAVKELRRYQGSRTQGAVVKSLLSEYGWSGILEERHYAIAVDADSHEQAEKNAREFAKRQSLKLESKKKK